MRLVTLTVGVTLAIAATSYAQDTVTIPNPLGGEPIVVPALPAPPDNGHTASTHVAIGALMAAHFVDLSTTQYLLGKCGSDAGCPTKDGGRIQALEANPALRRYSHNPMRFALAKYGIAAASIGSIYALHEKHPKLARWAALVQSGVIVAAALNNQRLLDATK